MTVKSNYLIANVTCSDWLKSLLPVFQPMRSNTNHSNMIIIFWCIRRQVYRLTPFFEAKNWGFTCLILLFSWPFKSMGFALIWGCRDGAVVRALASCQIWCHMWVEFVGSLLCSARFSPGTLVSTLLKNQHLIWFVLIVNFWLQCPQLALNR